MSHNLGNNKIVTYLSRLKWRLRLDFCLNRVILKKPQSQKYKTKLKTSKFDDKVSTNSKYLNSYLVSYIFYYSSPLPPKIASIHFGWAAFQTDR
jgi:hypothetical protein